MNNLFIAQDEIRVLVIGNANAGKSSVINSVTKRQSLRTGNWHGVTVSTAKGQIIYKGKKIILTDTPGIFSLSSAQAEECITYSAIEQGDYDVILNVNDAGKLERNLYLTKQLLALGVPVVLAYNMADEQKSLAHFERLSKILKTDCITVSAKKKTNLNKILDAIIKEAEKLNGRKQSVNIAKAIETQEYEPERLYAEIDEYLKNIGYISPVPSLSKLDKILMHRVWGIPIFFALCALIIYLAFGLFGKYIGGALEYCLDNLRQKVIAKLNSQRANVATVSFVDDALFGGIGGMLQFVPQVMILFFALNWLEDSGYFARVAYVFEDFMQEVGLNGRSCYTLLMGLGCSASAVYTARTIDQTAVRLRTVLVMPFLPCSARMPVFAAVAAYFFPSSATLAVIGLYLGGLAAAILASKLLSVIYKKIEQTELFFLELPKNRMPSITKVLYVTAKNMGSFLLRVCSVILLVNCVVWFFSNFDTSFSYTGLLGDNMLKGISKNLLPLLRPIGINDWRACAALIAGFVAKESVISVINSLGGVGEILGTPMAAASFLVFVLLYVPCVATIAAICKELGNRWGVISAAMHLVVAYVTSIFIYFFITVSYLTNRATLAVILIIISMAFYYIVNIKEKSYKEFS